MTETNRIEFKRELTRDLDIEKEVVAFFNEVPPKFELFSDRMEITSTGTLPDDMNQEDFFNGVSNPRNKELMRVFRDVELVESLGTGLQRVMKVYGKECFIFMDHFTRVVIPYAWLP